MGQFRRPSDVNPAAFVFYNPDQLIVNLAIVLWLSFETKSAEVLVWVTIMAMHSQSLSAYDAFQSKI